MIFMFIFNMLNNQHCSLIISFMIIFNMLSIFYKLFFYQIFFFFFQINIKNISIFFLYLMCSTLSIDQLHN